MSSIDQARQDLSLAHRLAVRHELNEGVWNHISLVSPENPDHLLISPGHTHWSLVRASNLALMDEGERMAAALGQKRVLILRNHGVLIAGPTVSDVYMDLYQFERACMYQILAMTGGGQMQLISDEIAAATGQHVKDGLYNRHFEGMRRWMQEIEPDYLT